VPDTVTGILENDTYRGNHDKWYTTNSLVHRWALTSLAPGEAGAIRAPVAPYDPGTPERAASQSLRSYNAPGMERDALCGARRGLDASC